MFRFDNYLTMSSEFTPTVQRVWQHHIVGTTMFAVTRKLKALKPISEATIEKREISRTMLATKLEQQMLHQRAKVAWMKGGDQCSRIFFHKAVFDIAEDKAPGPDGYSSGSFKAAWPVIGKEVTQAILDFFATGRLLKQVNATLLSLIPKVQNPTLVAEFRPISCCNLLYKELFQGYNQQHLPPRCELKVDIQKAYNTVEWDFLSAALKLFGFPPLFISWIEECITTPTGNGTEIILSPILDWKMMQFDPYRHLCVAMFS
ncbi:UNVERIFIED_CONTAM: hypothetical protein Slati_0887800 [Sesamum latifolium]|uniref:Reverse transcriptase domain-containing protein n=1 Tax=Sesamum latifolium TaxID=2727402 RepID=A0AAW2XT59_9LAMI